MPRLTVALSVLGAALVCGLVSACGGGESETAQVQAAAPEEEMVVVVVVEEEAVALSLEVTSPVLPEGEFIPRRYTCDGHEAGGQDVSPPLNWSGVPEGTKSIALILDDPDAVGRTFVHWVL